jgi:uncharacterized membrane protein YfcA
MPEHVFATTLILFAGSLLQGLAGLGGALISIPLVLLYAEPRWAAPVVVLCYTINRVPAMFVLRRNLMWDHSLLLIAAAIAGALKDWQVAEKRPSTSLPSPLVVATYWTVRLTPRDFGRLVSERF